MPPSVPSAGPGAVGSSELEVRRTQCELKFLQAAAQAAQELRTTQHPAHALSPSTATPTTGSASNPYAAVGDDLLAVLNPNLTKFSTLAEFQDKFIPPDQAPEAQAQQAEPFGGRTDRFGKPLFANRISLVSQSDLDSVLKAVKGTSKKDRKEFMADVLANLKAEPFKVSTQSKADAHKSLPNSEVELPGYLMHVASYKAFLSEELKKTQDAGTDNSEIKALLHSLEQSEAAVSAVVQGKKK